MTDTTTGVDWVDTRDMDWAKFHGLEVARWKSLWQREDGQTMVMIVWLPPGNLGFPLPHRHVHLTTYEHAFHLGGDLPHGEWQNPEAEQDVVVFKEGYFLDRKPKSIHGNEPIYSDTGCLGVFWRSGIGNWLDDEGADVETPKMEFEHEFKPKRWEDALPADWGSGVVLNRGGSRIVDTREMRWSPLGDVELAREKVLVRDDTGDVTVRLLFIPPGDSAVEPLVSHEDEWTFAYITEGELPVQGPDGVFVAKQGYFMTQAPGAPDGLIPAGSSETGAVVLQFRMGPNTWASPGRDGDALPA